MRLRKDEVGSTLDQLLVRFKLDAASRAGVEDVEAGLRQRVGRQGMPDGPAHLIVTDHVVLTSVRPHKKLPVAQYTLAQDVGGPVYVIVDANIGNVSGRYRNRGEQCPTLRVLGGPRQGNGQVRTGAGGGGAMRPEVETEGWPP